MGFLGIDWTGAEEVSDSIDQASGIVRSESTEWRGLVTNESENWQFTVNWLVDKMLTAGLFDSWQWRKTTKSSVDQLSGTMTSVADSVTNRLQSTAIAVTKKVTGTYQSVSNQWMEASEAWQGESERWRAEVTSWRYLVRSLVIFIFVFILGGYFLTYRLSSVVEMWLVLDVMPKMGMNWAVGLVSEGGIFEQRFHEIIHLAVAMICLFLICCFNILVFLLGPLFLPRKGPVNLQVEIVRNEAKMSWEYPETYPVQVFTFKLEDESGEQKTMEADGSARSYTFDDLEPLTDYQLSLTASTLRRGPGPEASINFTTKAAFTTPVNLQVELVRSVAKVSWEYPESYPVQAFNLKLKDERGEQKTMGPNRSARSFTFDDLEPLMDYRLSLSASTFRHGPGPEASTYFTTTAACKILIHGGYRDRKDKQEVWGDAAHIKYCNPRSCHSASVLPGRGVLVSGGLDGNNQLSSCELVGPVTLSSKSVKALPEPRWYHSSVTLGNDVLIAGGDVWTSSHYDWTTSTLLYRNDNWERCLTMEEPRTRFGMATDGTAAYVFGGYDSSSMATCERYDPATNRWTQLPRLPSRRYETSAVYLAGRFYVIGGTGAEREVWMLDPKSGSWEKGPDLNRARRNHCALAIDNRIWVFGGWGKEKTVEYYDPNRNAWTLCEKKLQLECTESAAVALPY